MTTAPPPRPRLSVIGLGKLGSPMAIVFGAKGFDVIGVDLNPAYVDAINAGVTPVEEPRLQEYFDLTKGRVRATTDYNDAIANSDISFIIVPTPSGPDGMFINTYVKTACEKIGAALRTKTSYHIVVITSTVMPGSTNGELRAALEAASGRTVGVDVGLCYNPEFIALGSVVRDMLFPDMILIGESDPDAGAMLETVYRQSVESAPEFHRMNLINAELCKISVNTFVTTKISYANMIADMCDHMDDTDAGIVTRAVGADSRIGRKYLKPAVGYGGPCFPRDNKAFSALGRHLGVNTALAEATDAINDHQLLRILRAAKTAIPRSACVLVLGLSYKPDTAVVEESQGVAIAGLLAHAGYRVLAFDPMANSTAAAPIDDRVTIIGDLPTALAQADAAIVMTPWRQFASIPGPRIVIDPWDIVAPSEDAPDRRIVRLGSGGWQRGA